MAGGPAELVEAGDDTSCGTMGSGVVAKPIGGRNKPAGSTWPVGRHPCPVGRPLHRQDVNTEKGRWRLTCVKSRKRLTDRKKKTV